MLVLDIGKTHISESPGEKCFDLCVPILCVSHKCSQASDIGSHCVSASYSSETSKELTKCFCQSLPAEVQKKTNF